MWECGYNEIYVFNGHMTMKKWYTSHGRKKKKKNVLIKSQNLDMTIDNL